MSDSNKELTDILDATSDAFFAVDPHWTILRVNAAHERVSQLPRSQQVGRSFLELFLAMPNRDQTYYWSEYNRAMQERVPVCFEEFYAPLGIWTSVNAYPAADGGLVVFYRDITAQKDSERRQETERQKFVALFAHSPVAMALLVGRDFVFEIVNARWSDLVSPRSYLGKPWAEAYPELPNSPLIGRLARVLETGDPYHAHEMELHVQGPDGSPDVRHYNFSYVRICDGAGTPYGVYCYTLDVTHEVRGRRLLEESERRLQEAVRARDAFLGIASHELKTPLTSWMLQAQISQRALRKHGAAALEPERVERLIETSVTQVQRLGRLVDDMLDVSRIASGKLSMHLGPVDLSALVAATAEAMAPELRAAGCALVVQVDEGVRVHADALRLEQVLGNLLTNAIKYARGAPVHVRLACQAQRALLTVRDHGPGIAPAMRARVFERFERLTSASEVSGLGLGLHIAQQIIQAHGGSIEASQPAGDGAAFVVSLRLAE